MASTVADVMTRDPASVNAGQPVSEAARLMRSLDTGVLIVTDSGGFVGVVTDRDLAVRVLADDRGPDTPVRDAASTDVETVGPDTSIEQVEQLMRSRAVRRIPVLEGGQAVGIVSIGDLALERGEGTVLGDISAAPGND